MRPFVLEACGNQRNEVSQRHTQTHIYVIPDTGSLMEQATHRYACPQGTTCTHSGADGCPQLAHLEREGLEAGGFPEDSDHLSTMLVIEEKGQVPIGLLRKSRTETRLQDRVTSMSPPQGLSALRTYPELCQIELRRIVAQHRHQG